MARILCDLCASVAVFQNAQMQNVESSFGIRHSFDIRQFVIRHFVSGIAGLHGSKKNSFTTKGTKITKGKRKSESPFSSSLCPCALCGSAVCVVIAPGAVAASFATTRVSQRFQQRAATAKERSAPPLRCRRAGMKFRARRSSGKLIHTRSLGSHFVLRPWLFIKRR